MPSNRRISRFSNTLSALLHDRLLAGFSSRPAARQPKNQPSQVDVETVRLAPHYTPVTATTLPLPIDVVEGSIRRLRWVSLGLAVASATVYVVGKTAGTWIDPDAAPASYRIACVLAALSGLGMFELAQSRLVSPFRLLDAALIFQVVGGFFISLGAALVFT